MSAPTSIAAAVRQLDQLREYLHRLAGYPITCCCCDQLFSVEEPPRLPAAWMCGTCVGWFGLLSAPIGQPGIVPLSGPAKSIRRLLACAPLSRADVAGDQSTVVLINVSTDMRDAWEYLLRDDAPVPLDPRVLLRRVR